MLLRNAIVVVSYDDDDMRHANIHAAIRENDLAKFHQLFANEPPFLNRNVNAINSTSATLLHVACFYGSLSIAEELLKRQDLILNPKNAFGETPLHFASLNGHITIVALLLTTAKRHNNMMTSLADLVDAEEGRKKWTPLFYALNSKLPDAVAVARQLIEDAHADVAHRDCGELTPLLVAIQLGRSDAAKMMIRNARVDMARLTEDTMPRTQDTAIHLSVWLNRQEIVGELLTRNKTLALLVNVRKETPLHLAVERNYYPLAKFILQRVDEPIRSQLAVLQDSRGRTIVHLLAMRCNAAAIDLARTFQCHQLSAAQNIADAYGEMPLEIAIQQFNCAEMVALFLSFNAEGMHTVVKLQLGYTPLMLAAMYGNLPVVQVLVKQSSGAVNVNEKNAKGKTALIFAAQNGHHSVVDFLVKLPGIRINERDSNGLTALMSAASDGHLSVVEVLLNVASSQVNVNEKNENGWTALMYASRNGHAPVVVFLLQQPGINVNERNQKWGGRTALMYAAWFGHLNVVELLASHRGVNVDQKDAIGQTALMYAAQWGHLTVVEFLLEDEDVDVNTKNKHGETALMLAAKQGHLSVVGALLKQPMLNIDERNNNGSTALVLALRKSHYAIAEKIKQKQNSISQVGKVQEMLNFWRQKPPSSSLSARTTSPTSMSSSVKIRLAQNFDLQQLLPARKRR